MNSVTDAQEALAKGAQVIRLNCRAHSDYDHVVTKMVTNDERKAWARQRRKTPTLYEGVDLRAQALRFAIALDMPKFPLDQINFRYSSKAGKISGSSWLTHVAVTVCQGAPVAEVLETLLHELVHCKLHHDAAEEYHRQRREGGVPEWNPPGHGPEFCATLVQTATKLWGIPVTGWKEAKAVLGCKAYGIDLLIIKELTQHLESALLPCSTLMGIKITTVHWSADQISTFVPE